MIVKELKIGESYLIESPVGSVMHEIQILEISGDTNQKLIKFTSATIENGKPIWRRAFSIPSNSTYISLYDEPKSYRIVKNITPPNYDIREDTIHA